MKYIRLSQPAGGAVGKLSTILCPGITTPTNFTVYEVLAEKKTPLW